MSHRKGNMNNYDNFRFQVVTPELLCNLEGLNKNLFMWDTQGHTGTEQRAQVAAMILFRLDKLLIYSRLIFSQEINVAEKCWGCYLESIEGCMSGGRENETVCAEITHTHA